MTYENNDQDYASGKSGRDRDINEMRARMSKPGKATAGDKILMNKWAQDVENGNASSNSIDFVNAMKSEGGWTEAEGSGLKPPENDPPPCSDEQEKDCLGICGGGRTAGEDGSCCRDSERDCNGECFGSHVAIGDNCCDRTNPDTATFCCLNPIESCSPPCPKPGQIISGHQFNNGCWCTPGDEHCCSASLLDSKGRCPEDAGYGLWAWEISEDICNCAEVPAEGLQPGQAGFTSEGECLNKCNQSIIQQG
jgi:hypothetical protein